MKLERWSVSRRVSSGDTGVCSSVAATGLSAVKSTTLRPGPSVAIVAFLIEGNAISLQPNHRLLDARQVEPAVVVDEEHRDGALEGRDRAAHAEHHPLLLLVVRPGPCP